jgi:hypothetical protein
MFTTRKTTPVRDRRRRRSSGALADLLVLAGLAVIALDAVDVLELLPSFRPYLRGAAAVVTVVFTAGRVDAVRDYKAFIGRDRPKRED